MSAVAWYATVVAILLPLSFLALRRLGWPAGTVWRLAAALSVALLWPLALPVLAFGSVALARLIQTRAPDKPRKAATTPVAPAA